ncbi:helix-turn-helix domain-containing protein [Aquimarina intermedia]|uniref:AraC-like DNA-binding protein n=1 Tax=Aquimarina intermedia TaxID=350814 RepID=A0A5S5C6W5_9FLAO|nr:AraC family transcriptional regulator [Aquimarina intermedia]TYP75094.1 AraC-like DNA-binding protein [Aquimarina intermedia]
MHTLTGCEIQEGHTVKNRFYEGTIDKCTLNNKVKIYECRLHCKTEFSLSFDIGDEACVCVNMEDKSSLSLIYFKGLNLVSPFSSVLLLGKKNLGLSFIFEPNKDYDFVLIKIAHSNFEFRGIHLSTLLDKLKVNGDNNCLKNNTPNLALWGITKNLIALNKIEIENKLIASGYCNIILGLKLKEQAADEKEVMKSNVFRSYEIKQLELITKIIEENPERQFCIKDLCKQSGLSVAKLQRGFKDMHNCTVAIFIRNVRLEKAIEMLKTTNLNISEIVYSVGLNSRSYFCRIFKKRFRCSPKHYQQMLRENHLSAS